MGTLADWPVEVSIFTKYGYSACCASTFMQNTSLKRRKSRRGILASFERVEAAAKRIYHTLLRGFINNRSFFAVVQRVRKAFPASTRIRRSNVMSSAAARGFLSWDSPL